MSNNRQTWRPFSPEKNLLVRKQEEGEGQRNENVEKHFSKFFSGKLEMSVFTDVPFANALHPNHREAILQKPL